MELVEAGRADFVAAATAKVLIRQVEIISLTALSSCSEEGRPPVREAARDCAREGDREGREWIVLLLPLKLPEVELCDLEAELLTQSFSAHTHTHYSHTPNHTHAQQATTTSSNFTRRSGSSNTTTNCINNNNSNNNNESNNASNRDRKSVV